MPTPKQLKAALLGCTVLALTACDNFDIDLRSNDANTSAAVKEQATADRPRPDARGVISYPSYQVAVAQRGDTVADVAARVGVPAAELSRFNGIPEGVALRKDEVLALPGRVAEPSPETGSITSGPIVSPDTIDITALADSAIQRADSQTTVTDTASGTKVAVATEPVRHKVERGETAYSISRLYHVSVRALAEWNGLGPDLSVREGQYLLIPVAADTGPARPETTTPPGTLSPVPTPPSAAEPLPKNETTATTPPPSPDLAAQKTVESQLGFPVSGKIIRGFQKKKNDGIDISADAGSPVKAAEAGTVAAITRDTDQVPILVLRHNDNLLTVYANIDNLKIKKGDSVKRGQTIGTVLAGTPAFLHFEVIKGDTAVDPVPYLN